MLFGALVGPIPFYGKLSDSQGAMTGQADGVPPRMGAMRRCGAMSEERFDAGNAQRRALVTNPRQTNGANPRTRWPVRRAAPRGKHRAPSDSTPCRVRQTRLPTERDHCVQTEPSAVDKATQ